MSQFEFSRNKSLCQNLCANAYWVYNTKEARVKEKGRSGKERKQSQGGTLPSWPHLSINLSILMIAWLHWVSLDWLVKSAVWEQSFMGRKSTNISSPSFPAPVSHWLKSSPWGFQSLILAASFGSYWDAQSFCEYGQVNSSARATAASKLGIAKACQNTILDHGGKEALMK